MNNIRYDTIYGLTPDDILELRKFWLEHHTYLPNNKPKEIKPSEVERAMRKALNMDIEAAIKTVIKELFE